jgi:hypothetical protein
VSMGVVVGMPSGWIIWHGYCEAVMRHTRMCE